jgi:hypothetical protein
LFASGCDRDVITDFTASGGDRDLIQLYMPEIASYQDLVKNHMVQSGSDVEIRGAGDDVIVLSQVNIKELSSANFLIEA